MNCGCDLDGDGSTTGDRPPGLQITVGRGDLEKQLQVINQDRATRGLAPLTIDNLKVLPPAKSIDMRLTKSFGLGQTRRLEVFLEAFNFTNFVNVTGGSGNFRLATFHVPTGAQPARQVQWGARYSF